jgi:hypothetical protein
VIDLVCSSQNQARVWPCPCQRCVRPARTCVVLRRVTIDNRQSTIDNRIKSLPRRLKFRQTSHHPSNVKAQALSPPLAVISASAPLAMVRVPLRYRWPRKRLGVSVSWPAHQQPFPPGRTTPPFKQHHLAQPRLRIQRPLQQQQLAQESGLWAPPSLAPAPPCLLRELPLSYRGPAFQSRAVKYLRRAIVVYDSWHVWASSHRGRKPCKQLKPRQPFNSRRAGRMRSCPSQEIAPHQNNAVWRTSTLLSNTAHQCKGHSLLVRVAPRALGSRTQVNRSSPFCMREGA